MSGDAPLPPVPPGLADRLRLAWLILKETGRALLFPLRMLLHLPVSGRTRARAARLLASPRATGEPQAPTRPARCRPVGDRGKPEIFLSLGDPSAETHALALMEALEAQGVNARWSGLGGHRLAAAGVELLADLTSRPVMGLGPVLARIPFFCGVITRVLARFRRRPPDLVVLIDSPALNLLIGTEARRRGIPTLYYICPQLWGWAPWRLARFRRAADAALCIFPFEPAFFTAAGVHCGWAGHPVADTMAANPVDSKLVESFGDAPTLALLPGSRPSDIESHLPLMVATANTLTAGDEGLRVLVAQEDPRRLELVRQVLAGLPGGDGIQVTPHLRELVTGARLTLVKSGTCSLEVALLGAPNLVVYVLESRLLRFAARWFLSVPWFGAANLIAGTGTVPELLLVRSEGERLREAAVALWKDEPALADLRRRMAEVREKALKPGAARVAARWVRALVEADRESDSRGDPQ